MPEPEIVAPVAIIPDAAPAPVADDAAARFIILEKELKEARSDAAKYRTTLRTQETAQEAAAAAALVEQGKFKELYEKEQLARTTLEAAAALATATLAKEKLQLAAATAAGLPATMAARLVGATAEDLAADATALAVHFKIVPPSTGSTNPGTNRGTQQAATFDLKNPPRLSSIDWKK